MNEPPTHAAPGGRAPLGGRTVARIGYGAMQLERHAGDPDAGLAVLRRALERGVDHLDTAQFYGHGFVNDLVRRAVPADGGVVVATKVGATPDPGGPHPMRPAQRPDELRADVEANLRTLGRERLDLVYLRRLDIGPGLPAVGEQLVDVDHPQGELVAQRDAGPIGEIGNSPVRTETMRRALPAGIVAVQNAYSLLDRRFEDGLALCAGEGVAWVPYFPLGSAFPGIAKVTDDPAVRAVADAHGVTPAQIGLAWLLGHAPHLLLIPGTADVGHLDANVEVGDIQLSAAETAELDAVGSATVTAEVEEPGWPGRAR